MYEEVSVDVLGEGVRVLIFRVIAHLENGAQSLAVGKDGGEVETVWAKGYTCKDLPRVAAVFEKVLRSAQKLALLQVILYRQYTGILFHSIERVACHCHEETASVRFGEQS